MVGRIIMDVTLGGHQVLVDQSMTLATSFLKSKVDGSGYGGDWAVRIDVQSE